MVAVRPKEAPLRRHPLGVARDAVLEAGGTAAAAWGRWARPGGRRRPPGRAVLRLVVVVGVVGVTAVGVGLALGGWERWDRAANDANDDDDRALWSWGRIDRALQCDSRRIARQSADHLRSLMVRARRELQERNRTVYGTPDAPLLGFFIPKTGSNTQEHYHLAALAAIRQPSFSLCEGGENAMYACLSTDAHHRSLLCRATAFGNHFHPHRLLDSWLDANCTAGPADAPPPRSWWSRRAALSHRDLLRDHSVCTIVFRDPVERLVSGYYEWQYQKTTQLSAVQYLQEHGPAHFPMIESQANWVRPGRDRTSASTSASATDPATEMLEAVFSSCVVGVTEDLVPYVEALSRVLWVTPPAAAAAGGVVGTETAAGGGGGVVRARSRVRAGIGKSDARLLRRSLAPLLQEEAALWHLARRVSAAQARVARQFPPLLPTHAAPRRTERQGPFDFDCSNCTRCTPPGWERLRWTSYRVAAENGGGEDGCLWPGARTTDAEGRELRCCAHADGN